MIQISAWSKCVPSVCPDSLHQNGYCSSFIESKFLDAASVYVFKYKPSAFHLTKVVKRVRERPQRQHAVVTQRRFIELRVIWALSIWFYLWQWKWLTCSYTLESVQLGLVAITRLKIDYSPLEVRQRGLRGMAVIVMLTRGYHWPYHAHLPKLMKNLGDVRTLLTSRAIALVFFGSCQRKYMPYTLWAFWIEFTRPYTFKNVV